MGSVVSSRFFSWGVCALALFGGGALSSAKAADWSAITTPTSGPTRSIGSPALGCLAGGVALPLDGEGYHVLRPQRHRYYGQPVLLQTITALARQMAQRGHGAILVGDMSQPRGGRMSFGHASHQNGLDVDIWLKMVNGPLDPAERAEPTPVSMVASGAQEATPGLWGQAQEDLVHLAAQEASVARIFVNPAIKATLCQRFSPSGEGASPAWLSKVRPWRGHDEHIHVRLSCPPSNKDCVDQDPPPAGNGCGAELASWFAAPPPPVVAVTTPVVAKPAPSSPVLPKACRAVLK